MSSYDVVVVGAGQAGLSAAHALVVGGLARDRFVVLDANPGPGGAWRHRWPSLTLGAAHRIHPLPGLPLPDAESAEPASAVVARYFGEYERVFDLPVQRPVRVMAVTGPDLEGPLGIETSAGLFEALTLVSATGTWERPYWPYYPGRETFRGRQLHTHDFRSADEFRGLHVVVVGAGTLPLTEAYATPLLVERSPRELRLPPGPPGSGSPTWSWRPPRPAGGGIVVDGVRVAKDPRIFLVGYGASASTLGATRAGRQAARAALQQLAIAA